MLASNSSEINQESALSPYLSVVAVSRNDDHGGDPLIRTQIFINCLAAQCLKFELPCELVLVDWNPPAGRPNLSAVLEPADNRFFSCRVVSVPPDIHAGYKYSDKLQLFQMIGKNVGIRRAKGEFVLVTNIDVLFSNELIQFISRQKLDPHAHYRVDRYDIRSGLEKTITQEDAVDHAWRNVIRSNRRLNPLLLLQHLYGAEGAPREVKPEAEYVSRFRDVSIVCDEGVWQVHPLPSCHLDNLHTNGCGDFALMSRRGWETVRGYPEFEAFSFNIDSMGLVASHYAGFREISLLPPCVCFHIEHSVGSGWSPEGHNQLFGRLRSQNIVSPDWPVLMPLIDEMRERQEALEFNYSSWGLQHYTLQESSLGEALALQSFDDEQREQQFAEYRIGAIKPEFDYDRLALAHERKSLAPQGYSVIAGAAFDVRLFIPDEQGLLDGRRNISCSGTGVPGTPFLFSVEQCPNGGSMYLSPSAGPALVELKRIRAVDRSGSTVMDIGPGSKDVLVAGKDIRRLGDTGEHQLFLVTGGDPQFVLPSMPENVQFPLFLLVEMSLFQDRRLPG